jgi:hypothetical protein
MSVKIKLAAIAKDEAAYLPEWIFHHLYFGVDEIEIYINNTNDNSIDILKSISKNHPVKSSIEDKLFDESNGCFQVNAYKKIASQALKDGFSHILFLDIDEFWTSEDFKTSIKEYLNHAIECDVHLFNWAMHLDEDEEFSLCFNNKLRLRNAPQVKYLIKLSKKKLNIGIHNAIGDSLTYSIAGEQLVSFDQDDNFRSKINCVESRPPNSQFIIHRVYRSQMEYVSLLTRGRPHGPKIKNNRFGYYTKETPHYFFYVPNKELEIYKQKFDIFLNEINIDVLKSRKYILKRYQNAIELFNGDLSDKDKKTLKIALRNITLTDIDSVNVNINKISEINLHLDNIRNAAEFFARKNEFELALDIMNIAKKIRPHGPVINKKIDEYLNILGGKK